MLTRWLRCLFALFILILVAVPSFAQVQNLNVYENFEGGVNGQSITPAALNAGLACNNAGGAWTLSGNAGTQMQFSTAAEQPLPGAITACGKVFSPPDGTLGVTYNLNTSSGGYAKYTWTATSNNASLGAWFKTDLPTSDTNYHSMLLISDGTGDYVALMIHSANFYIETGANPNGQPNVGSFFPYTANKWYWVTEQFQTFVNSSSMHSMAIYDCGTPQAPILPCNLLSLQKKSTASFGTVRPNFFGVGKGGDTGTPANLVYYDNLLGDTTGQTFPILPTSGPVISSLSQSAGSVGTAITITGNNFGASQGGSTVTFNGTAASPTSWSTTSIGVPVPAGATTGNVVVTVTGASSNSVPFTVTSSPFITGLSPSAGPVGTQVTISGANFGSSPGSVAFNGTPANPSSWSGTSIVVPVPTGATTGNLVVTAGGVASNAVPFTVNPAFSVVQVAQNFSASSNTSVTVPINTTAGHLLVIYAMQGGSSAATVKISDSAGQTTWTQTSSGYASSATSNRSAMFYIANSAAVTSVTATWTASASNIGAIVYEIAGGATSSPADGSVNSSLSGSGITSLTSGNLTTTNANDILIYAARSQSNETTFTAGPSYTIPTNGSNTRQGMQYEVVAATQTSVNTSMSWNAGAPGAAGIFAAFKAAIGGGGGSSTITATSGTPQSATVNMPYGTQFQATLKDSSNNPISGATVTWSAPTSGASGTFAGGVNTAMTNASGVAMAPVFTANTAAGTYTVTVTANGVGTPASYNLTNLAAAAMNIAATAGSSQSAAINTAFGTPFQATVKDSFGNPVSGVTVTWTAPGSGASGTFANGVNTATTNASGVATAAVFSANGTSGSYQVSASAPGVATPANFSLTNATSTYALSVSISSSRNYYANGLQGASVEGLVYVFTSPASQPTNFSPTGITSVSFWLDNTAMTGSPTHTQTTSPYDFLGTTNTPGTGLGTPWDTSTVADGQHTITQSVTESNGTIEVDTATFTVQNNLPFTINTGKYEYVFPDGGIFVYDLSNFQLVKHVSMPQLNAVRGAGVVPSTHMLYISYGGAGGSTGNGSLLKYDLLTDTVVWTQNYSHGVDTFSITPDGSTIYMPDGSQGSDGIWDIVNATTGAETGSINSGGAGPHNTIVSLDGAKVFMGPIGSTDLVEANTSTNTVAVNIGPLHQFVRPFTINGFHTLAFTTGNLGSGIGFQVSDTTTGNVLYSVSPPGFSIPSGFTINSANHGISLSPDEKEIYLIDIANAYAHVFDVSGLPSSAPVDVADIPLNTNFQGFQSPCSPLFNCIQEGWIRHTLDGQFVLVSDSGDVINTSSRTVVGTIPQLLNTRSGNLEVDWQNGLPVATTTHYGLGHVTAAGPPAGITATGGTPQNAIVNTPFATQLQSTVKDGSGHPVSGVTVTFTAPASGASGTFANGVNTAVTNASGVATAPVFTANGTTGSYTVTASASGVSTSASFSLTNLAPSAISVVQVAQNFSATSNTSITVPVSTTAGHLLVVYTMNGGNNTATVTISDSAGQTWTQTTSGYASSASSNRSAMFYVANSAAVTSVTATWTASANNIGAIVYEITGAAMTSAADGSVNSSVSGTGITSLSSGSLTTTNANDILIYGARSQTNETTFTAGSGYTIPANGSNTRQGMQYEVVTTTQTGVTTSMSWGTGTVGAAGIFAAFKVPSGPPPPSIAATGGTPQSTVLGTAFSVQLQATLKDGMGNPINGATVTWSAPTSGASATFAGGVTTTTSTTNAQGVAAAPAITANNTAGAYTVTATATGVTAPASFSLTNTSAPPATIAATGGSSQSTAVNTPFATPLQVTALDGLGNPVSGVVVTFSVPSSGPSGTFASGANTATTNASGVATAAKLTANGTAGSFTVTASASGAATSASFSMTNLAAPPISVVQVQQAFSASNNTSITVPITSTVGHLLVAYVMQGGNNTATVTMSDSAGQTWTQTTSGYASSATSNRSAMLFVANSAAVTSVTVTWTSAASNIGAIVYEISGLATATPADGSVNSSVSGTGITSLSSGSLTTTNANDILIYGARSQTNETIFTAGPGYTIPTNASNTRQGMQYEVVATTQTGAATSMSWGTGTVGAAGIFAAFKSANGAAAPISVSVSPTTATAPSGYGTVNVVATLLNDFQQLGVTFTLSGNGCSGSTCGTLTNVTSTSVTYNAPANVPNPAAIIVTATSMADSSKWATATITVTQGTLHVSLSPTHTAITTSQTQQFAATVVNNTQNATVSLLVDGVVGGNSTTGTITSGGLYTPPNTVGNHTVMVQVSTQSASAPVFVTSFPGVFMRDVDTMRTGQNLNETVLTTANVNSTTFGKLFSYPLDGVSDASPLYVANVNIPGQGLYDVVYVETEHNSAYAFDADGTNPNPLWHVSFLNSSGGTTVTTVSPSQMNDTAPNMAEAGITGTPVIDTSTGTIYMVAVTAETTNGTTNFVQRLHALDITTGAEKFNGPVVIQGCVPGTGDGSSGGQVCFSALRENQRAALLLSNGVVYIAWGAHADHDPYHGWVMGYSASTLNQVMLYNTSPNGSLGRAGIWQSGDGLAMDASGRIFFVTGNGVFDANNTGGTEYGDSIVALNTNGTVSDYFTPFDQANMASNDLDMGSGGTLLLPDQLGPFPHEAISSGKNGTIYLVNRDAGKMGGYNTSNNNQIIQTLNVLPGGTFQTGNFKAPVYFNGSVYFSADADNLEQFTVTNGLLSTSAASQTTATFGYPGATMQVSANGSSNGILWAIERFSVGNQAAGNTANGVLHAFNAMNLANELYNSNQAANNRDNLNDGAAKWAAPLVVNGKVIVASSSRLTIFGLF